MTILFRPNISLEVHTNPHLLRFGPHKQSKVIVEIESQTGIYALSACAMNVNAKVSSFEPIPVNVQRQSLNISLNAFENIKRYDGATAIGTETLDMHVPDATSDNLAQGVSFKPFLGNEASRSIPENTSR